MLNKLKDKIIKIIKNPLYIFYWLDKKRVITLNDKKYLEILYKKAMNENINWTEPNTFNEKLQWFKLYDRNPEYIKMVDKLDDLIENRENKVLEDALIIKEGKIIDLKIIKFQNRE